jgi:hypothetical protein
LYTFFRLWVFCHHLQDAALPRYTAVQSPGPPSPSYCGAGEPCTSQLSSGSLAAPVAVLLQVLWVIGSLDPRAGYA